MNILLSQLINNLSTGVCSSLRLRDVEFHLCGKVVEKKTPVLVAV